MNTNKRFAVIVAILVMGCVITGASGVYGLMRMAAALDTVVSKDMTRFLKVTDVRKLMRSVLVTEQSYILESSPEKRHDLEVALEKSKKDFFKTFDDYSLLALSDDRDQLPKLREAFDAWQTDDVKVLELARNEQRNDAYALSSRKKTSPSWEEIIKSLIEADQKALAASTASTLSTYEFYRGLITLVCFGAILIGLVAGIIIFRAISRTMRETVQLKDDLALANTGLESKVLERTRAISTILDHVSFGLVVCDQNLLIKSGYSRSCTQILGTATPDIEGASLLDILKVDPRNKENFASLYAQIFDADFLLGDLAVDQLPTRFQVGDSSIGLTGSVVHDDAGKSIGVLFCIADISSLVAAEVEIERNRGMIKMLGNRDSFRQFVTDVQTGFERIYHSYESGGDAVLRRELHTLKGNMGVYNLNALAAKIHTLEDDVSIQKFQVEQIEAEFQAFIEDNRNVLGVTYGVANDDSFVIPGTMVDAVEVKALEIRDAAELRDIVSDFFRMIRLKRARTVLGPIEDSFAQLASRLGKQASLVVTGGETLVPTEAVGVFKSLTHLLRNALDHGIEAPDRRSHKGETGSVQLSITEHVGALRIVLSDDGKGIRRDALSDKVKARGLFSPVQLASMSDEQVFDLIFLDGISTAGAVTDISGRGVGMAAVKAAVEAIGGTIRVASRVDVGTTFTIDLPRFAGRRGQNAKRLAA